MISDNAYCIQVFGCNYFLLLTMRRIIGLVAKAEEQLGFRFTDDAAPQLAFVFATISNRVQNGNHLDVDE